ncbi:MAG: hypothetical protein GX595_04620 [Lentisphaerae bacterium]|nr:hypothetical protein [Lentisphaerota bacterium]
MHDPDILLSHLPSLSLQRLGPAVEAGLYVTSLPWPRAAAQPLCLGGGATWCRPLGQWPDAPAAAPRRLLVVSQAGAGAAPAALRLSSGAGAAAVAPAGAPPSAEFELVERCTDPGFMWERHLLRLRWGGRSLGLMMGLRHAGEVHWWECCRMVVLEETPACRVVEMGGAIPHRAYGAAERERYRGYVNPFLHRHNWLYGTIVARLHANGVCEIVARHVNSKFHDDGADLEDVVPVIGVVSEASASELAGLCGPWTGQVDRLSLGGVAFDLAEAARLATPEKPGSMEAVDGRLVWQPYAGAEIYSGAWARQTSGDPFICHAEKRLFIRGLARTVRFSLSLSECSPRVVRYLAPSWWYGLCEEFHPAALLPVSNDYDRTLEDCRAYVRRYEVRGGFEDGALPRHGNAKPAPDDHGRSEAGWEGEAPWAQFLLAYRFGAAEDFDDALRSAYHFTDVAIDHAAKQVRMHGFSHHAFAPPMNRVMGTLAAYLETGDEALADAARAVVETAHWVQKNAWPRNTVGRDGKYVRSAAFLYRYLGEEHYRRIAHEGARMIAASQRANGSFGDQSGGTGVHQLGAYITKPWMGLMATEGVLDLLEICPGDAVLIDCVRRFGDWLMRERVDCKGTMGWRYQHDFDGQRRYFDGHGGSWWDLPGPSQAMWHQNSLGRLLGTCTLLSGDPSYLDAWAESYAANPGASGDHGVATSAHPIPWLQDRLWNATLSADGIAVAPLHFGPRTPERARLQTPEGTIDLAWRPDGTIAGAAQGPGGRLAVR